MTSLHYEQQYLDLCNKLLTKGVWINNSRTGKRCLSTETTIFQYDVGAGEFPLITTRKAFYKMAIAEVIGYWQGLTNANDFVKLGCATWLANSNKNTSWLNNPNRKGDGDMGNVYGYFGHNFGGVNQFEKVYNNLSNGIDDRGEIITYWKPDQFSEGCLRPCLHSVQFNLLGGILSMTATQRSCDVPLGLVSNIPQCWIMLYLMARITGHKAGKVTHVINQPHVYEDQVDLLRLQLNREPIDCKPEIEVCDSIQTWEDIMNLKNMDKFMLYGYQSHDRIDFPFSE
ncbi:thymidylate synthase [Shewanella sp. phage 1/40]|uniref:thymidylate synthase n=1 Tax=Shewanella phage 1/4 TaxID=1458859 RepID=UPI0004F8DD8E|nr:thymidylate synthase [Shewanella sp. phage 1/4]YP_009104036.1 thymidylate synthase [Shewanella sp. phage 1/40]AHK11150.1 thymidylate synthase [Shewanella sp. phage 1/4]AHK11445.1 thymidylate synthase [Shewanella sp. phage 1/40]